MLQLEGYERIRRLVKVEGKSQRAAARETGHSRNTVAKVLREVEPPGYRRAAQVQRPVIDPFKRRIEEWLKEDRKRPRKQRHTAERIFERLRDEEGYSGSASAVRRFVQSWKAEQGRADVFVPLVFEAGEEAQVDWGQAQVERNGVLVTVWVFCMRLCYSGASFAWAYMNATMEAFLDGHVRAFEYFGGVPRRIAYDNLKCAVTKIMCSRERKLNETFLRLRNHYLFETRFCNRGQGNEKGHVENLVKDVQRRFMTPVPDVSGLEDVREALGISLQSGPFASAAGGRQDASGTAGGGAGGTVGVAAKGVRGML